MKINKKSPGGGQGGLLGKQQNRQTHYTRLEIYQAEIATAKKFLRSVLALSEPQRAALEPDARTMLHKAQNRLNVYLDSQKGGEKCSHKE